MLQNIQVGWRGEELDNELRSGPAGPFLFLKKSLTYCYI